MSSPALSGDSSGTSRRKLVGSCGVDPGRGIEQGVVSMIVYATGWIMVR